ncbi:TetR/AcrR family transcriptional regulator [Nocardia sp. CDC159]|uniref:TetR/AcrR family transcriptional regulator n=1 Tax=Nocardia pulmonis TaxID=2951408 RepID=A0A9X2EAT0_9NOCA|nr:MULTISPECIES: TetR/AcrR family transcriptional regulator [Nocardia]MCM6776795.1 TetR/AcrR family transcriptional regulator [Nocardia pulmonis]MCM6789056.1 TetR/AcrR family transcriptional regulator [Nocardia sp. CDC159]
MTSPRPHTGRRRNDAARRAILEAAAALLARSGGTAVSTAEIAAAAGVSKQTIYRWWPSKGAVLLEAMTEWARESAPDVDTGNVRADLLTFLTATFAAATTPPAAALLRAVLAEAQTDPATTQLLADFARERRAILRDIFARAEGRGELDAAADPELLVDQIYGVLWYRLAVARTPLDAEVAVRLVDSLRL